MFVNLITCGFVSMILSTDVLLLVYCLKLCLLCCRAMHCAHTVTVTRRSVRWRKEWVATSVLTRRVQTLSPWLVCPGVSSVILEHSYLTSCQHQSGGLSAIGELYVLCSYIVVVIAPQLFSYRQLSRLRKSATAATLSHKSCTVSCIGWLWQVNRCSMECGATPHSRQTSDMRLVMWAL